MKKSKTSFTILSTLFVLFISLSALNHDVINSNSENNHEFREVNKDGLENVKKAGHWTNFTHIYIENGNWSDVPCITGDGSFSNPYIIENMTIDATNTPDYVDGGIHISNTPNDYFEIRNCTIFTSNEDSYTDAIYLKNCKKGTIYNNTLKSKHYQINLGYASSCENITIHDNIMQDGDTGISVSGKNITISNNTIMNMEEEGIEINAQFIDVSDVDVLNNNITNCKYGIRIDHYYDDEMIPYAFEYNDIFGNLMWGCGVDIETGNKDIDIDFENNEVNDKPLYFYRNELNLGNNNYSDAGQILLINCNNTIISDLDLSNGTSGITLLFCYNSTLSGNIVSYNKRKGIYLHCSDNNTIVGNNASYCIWGIELINSDYSNVSGNFLYHNKYGIANEGSNNNFSLNLFKNSGLDISRYDIETTRIDQNNLVNGKPLYFYKNNNSLKASDFQSAGQLILYNCNNSQIINQDVSNGTNGLALYYCYNNYILNVSSSFNQQEGLILYKGGNNKIFESNFNFNNLEGIYFRSSNNNTFYHNNITNNMREGIDMDGDFLCSNNRFLQNNISYNLWDGLKIDGWDIENITISNNIFEFNGGSGVDLWSVSNSTISNNNVTYNMEEGIRLRGALFELSRFNDISNNKFISNQEFGLYLYSSSNGCGNNTIWNNTFIGNTVHAYDSGNNFWNSSQIGNFWDNYTGVDANDDGIGDLPYIWIGGSGNSRDYLPIWDDGIDLQGDENSDDDDGDDEDDTGTVAIPIGNYYLIFVVLGVLSLIIITKHKMNLK